MTSKTPRWFTAVLMIWVLSVSFLYMSVPIVRGSVVGSRPDSGGSGPTTAVAKDLRAAVLPLVPHTNGSVAVTFHNGTQFKVVGHDAPLYSRPYVGGWMTANGCQPNTYCTASAVEAAISFPNTSPSVIPAGNFLEGTINLQGQSSQNGVDFAIRAAHVLYPDGSHGVVADMWQTCEGPAFGCSPTSATELTAFILSIYGLTAGQVIYVQIQATSTVINWLYSYDGNTWTQYYSFTPPSIYNHQLYLGTVNVIDFPYYTAYYYQFGVWAQSAYSGTFNVEFQNPSYYRNGAWTAIPTAETIYGEHSFFDETWTYSNTHNNWNINANNPNPGPTVIFYDSSSIIGENVRLWG